MSHVNTIKRESITKKIKNEVKNALIKLSDMWDDVKSVIAWLFVGLVGILLFFFRSMYFDFRKVYKWYEATNQDKTHGCAKHGEMVDDINKINLHIQTVEGNSKKYFGELSSKMEYNHSLLLEKMNSIIELNKQNNGFVKEELNSIKSNIDRVEKSVTSASKKNFS